jgi:uncharacterized membrane protein
MHRLNNVYKTNPAIYFLMFFTILCFNLNHVCAQNNSATQISGTVTDSSGQPLPLVSVSVKGTRTATTTNPQGSFTISVNTNATLVFSYVVYNKQEIKLNGEKNINVSLQQTTNTLGDVVVTALGIKKEKRSVGYSVSEVKGSSLTEVVPTILLMGWKKKLQALM